MHVHSMDVLGDTVNALSSYLGSVPVAFRTDGEQLKPQRKPPLSTQYFKRITAVEYAIKQDDGANPKGFRDADMVLVGISRTQKTPMASYLAQQFGLKVANYKLVLGQPLDPELSAVDPRRIFALTCQADYLYKVRRRRMKMPGDPPVVAVAEGHDAKEYASLEYIKKELEWAHDLFKEHPEWMVVDTTGVSVEEVSEVHIRPNLARKPTPIEGALEALSCNFAVLKVDNSVMKNTGAAPGGGLDAGGGARGSEVQPSGGATEEEEAAAEEELSGNAQLLFDEIVRKAAAGAPASWWQGMQVMFMSDKLCDITGVEALPPPSGVGVPSHPWRGSTNFTIVDMCRALTGPNTEAAALRQMLSALYSGLERTVVLTVHASDGSSHLTEVHVSPIKNSARQIALVLVSMRELDVKKNPNEQQQRLFQRTRRQTFYTVLDATSPGLPLWYASKGFFKMTGYTEPEILARLGEQAPFALWGDAGSDARSLLGELGMDELAEVKEKVAEGLSVNTCFKSYRKDGNFFWNLAHLEPVKDDVGTLRWYVGTHHAVMG